MDGRIRLVRSEKISKKIRNKYSITDSNVFESKFYQDLFTGYEFTFNKSYNEDFFRIEFLGETIKTRIVNGCYGNLSRVLEKEFGEILKSLALYGEAYLYIRPEYTFEESPLLSLEFKEVKGIKKNNIFYFMKSLSDNEINKLDEKREMVLSLKLKETGYKLRYFSKIQALVKRLYGVCFDNKPIKNVESFSVLRERINNEIMKNSREIGWYYFGENLSESHILYRKMKMIIFKVTLLDYILNKLNIMLLNSTLINNYFKITVNIEERDYNNIWMQYQRGELTESEVYKLII